LDQETTYKWIQDRLRDLHSGTLSEADRARLEQIAVNDPFVKDALEGYKAHSDHDHSVLLNVLSNRIRQKRVGRHVKLVPLSRGMVFQAVAASLVLILATWSVIYYIGKEEKSILVSLPEAVPPDLTDESLLQNQDTSYEDVAMEEKTVTDELNAEPPGLRANAQARMEAQEQAKAKDETKAKAQAEAEAKAKESIATDVTVKESDGYTFDNPKPATAIYSKPAAPTNAEVLSSKPAEAGADLAVESSAKRDEGYYANQMSPEMMAQRVTGQVILSYGEPVIGALVTIPNTNLVTTTDDYGRFELYLPEPKSQVSVSYNGMFDTTVTVKQGQEDIIVMLQDAQPRITPIITGSQLRSSEEMFNYMDKNSTLPLQKIYEQGGKKVTVEFNININGRAENLSVVEAPDEKKYEKEAVRLIKEQPYWVCDNGSPPCKMKYTIYFK